MVFYLPSMETVRIEEFFCAKGVKVTVSEPFSTRVAVAGGQ